MLMKIRLLWSVLSLAAGIAASQAQVPAPPSNVTNGSFLVTRADVPLYPSLARAARLSGTVQVRVSVKNGSVASTETQSSSAAQILVNAARANATTWRFAPDANGTFEVTYIYELEKDEVVVPENPRVEMQLPSLVKITAKPAKPTTVYGK
jgi:TonB family protein